MDPSFKLIVDGSEIAEGVLRRAVAPAAVWELERIHRVSGNALIREDSVGIVTRLKVGAAKSRLKFKAGEVAINPADGSLWVFLSDAESRMPLVPLGSVLQGLEGLRSIRRGARLELVVRTG
ncbi:MAG: hypothetical protein RXP91_00235 [Nitrososphaeria archaeon]|jgi:hypothetical protein